MSDDRKERKKRAREQENVADVHDDGASQAALDVATESSSAPTTTSALSKKAKRAAAKEVAAAEAAAAAAAGDYRQIVKSDDNEDAQVDDDTPALSHKERRLAKKRKLAAEAQGLEPMDDAELIASIKKSKSSATKTGSARAGTASEGLGGAPAIGNTPAKSAHGVWIGNMNYATASKDLIAWLEQRGLKEITRINMPGGKRAYEANRGFAYVDFPTETDQSIAVGLSEQHLDGRKLLIKASSDYSGRPTASASAILPSDLPASALVQPVNDNGLGQDLHGVQSGSTAAAPSRAIVGVVPPTLNRTARKILDRQRNPPGPTLFLGNLGFETGAEDIREMFDAHQRAAAAWLPRKVREEKEAEERRLKMEERGRGKSGKGKSSNDEDDQEDGSHDSDDSDDDDEENVVDTEDQTMEDTSAKNGAVASDDEDEAEDDADDDEDEDEDEGSSSSDEEEDASKSVDDEKQDCPAEPVKPKRIRVKKKKAPVHVAEDEKDNTSSKGPKGPLDLTKAKDAGIRKIRLGTFEDTGKCKGWAFVDFHLPEQATRALLNIRNHTLDGRSLNVEYASAEAVRRGGLGTKRAGGAGAGAGAPRGGGGGRGRGGAIRGGGRGGSAAGTGRSSGRDWDDNAMRDFAAQPRDDGQGRDAAPHFGSRGGYGAGRGGGHGGPRGGRDAGPDRESRPSRPQKDSGVRAKPGAALASAQRASEGIVQSTGRKITFD